MEVGEIHEANKEYDSAISAMDQAAQYLQVSLRAATVVLQGSCIVICVFHHPPFAGGVYFDFVALRPRSSRASVCESR